jgi:hypothetical protein
MFALRLIIDLLVRGSALRANCSRFASSSISLFVAPRYGKLFALRLIIDLLVRGSALTG